MSNIDRFADPAAIVLETLDGLTSLAPAGFAIGMHIRFMTPRYMFESYPAAWRDLYGREGYLMRDPTVRWAMHNHGAVRWTALRETDGAGIFEEASAYGIRHGHSWSIHENGVISFGGFARPDRDFTDAEIARVGELMQRLHDATHSQVTLGSEASLPLRDMAVVMTAPGRSEPGAAPKAP